jgi:ATP-dependent Clp protease ATP-binding subunit ClpA
MGVGTEALLELARRDARSRRHRATELEHVLSVALGMDEIRRALLERGIDPVELRDRLDVRLTAVPSLGGYRDASDAPLSSALEAIVARLRGGKWRPFRRAPSLVDAALGHPSIARLVVELRRGNDFRHLLERARALAIVQGHELVGIEHMLSVLLDLPSFVETLERAGGDAVRLRAAVDAVLDAARRSDRPDGPRFCASLREALSIGPEGAYAGATPLSVREACLALTRVEEAVPLWSSGGTLASDVRRAIHIPSEDARRRR